MTRALLLLLLAACTATSSPRPLPAAVTLRTLVTVPIACMMPPPPVELIDWPDADRLGNRVLHWSTVEKVRDALVAYRRYIDESWTRCQDAALEREIREQEQR